MARDWLKKRHPLYVARREEWERNERRYRGGVHILPELRRFDWETRPLEVNMVALDERNRQTEVEQAAALDRGTNGVPGEHYKSRQNQATYLNFPEAFMGMLRGHLFRKAPAPDSGALNFGGLGEVRTKREGGPPSNGELVYYNVDGVGNDGSQWDAWWSDVTGWSGVTGHRWLFVEAPLKAGITQADVIAGNRPYLVHHSPLEVLNWDYVEGRLAWALIQMPPRAARIQSGDLIRDKRGPVRLYVRRNFTELDEPGGIAFSTGGWWTFDENGDEVMEPGSQGFWDKTNGEIPLWPHFYQRDKENFSRSAVTEIGSAAVAYMNLDSAASFDAWDAASSLTFLLGVDPTSFQVAMDKVQDGSKYIPVPLVKTDIGGAGQAVVPSVQDSAAGAVTSDVFTKRMLAIRESIREITGMEVSGVPDASGLSKQAGFGETKSPRLALLASEVETSQNIALIFLERRFGGASPSASVTWMRDFELAPVMDSIERVFDLSEKSGVSSPTLTARAMMTAARETGLVTDDKEAQTVQSEFEASARVMQTSRAQDAGLGAEFGRDGTSGDAGASGGPESSATASVPSGVSAPASQEIQTTTDTVLNGAQVSAATDIVKSVAAGELPRDAGVAMIQMFFNLTKDKAEMIMGSAGKEDFTPAKKDAPAPAPGFSGLEIVRDGTGRASHIRPASTSTTQQ